MNPKKHISALGVFLGTDKLEDAGISPAENGCKMTEKEFLTKFIDYVYYTDIKSNWYLAIDGFLQQTPPLWTAEYPTQPGYYWLRNYAIQRRPEQEPNISVAPQLIELYPDALDELYWIGNDVPLHRKYLVSGEWSGPILPPENTEPVLEPSECMVGGHPDGCTCHKQVAIWKQSIAKPQQDKPDLGDLVPVMSHRWHIEPHHNCWCLEPQEDKK